VKREFKIKLGDAEFPVEAEGNTITVDGRPYTVEVTEEGKVLVDGIAHDVALEGETATVDAEAYDVQAVGLTLAAATPPPVAASTPGSAEAGAGAVLAIMPGKIIRVLVEVGQACVRAGGDEDGERAPRPPGRHREGAVRQAGG
jgi:biotin carboxyl carrier protein